MKKKKLLVLVLSLTFVSAASAQVFIDDDFESYGDSAALDPPWALTVGTTADSFLDMTMNGPTLPGEQSVHHTTVAAGRDFTDFAPFEVTGSDYVVWGYDFYDFVAEESNPRQYGQLLAGSGGLNELIAMGQYNAAGPVHDPTKYQARVAFGGPNWFNLNTPRSVGWHRFEAYIYADTVDFYVDGALDTGGVSHSGTDWYNARIGSGLSSAGGEAVYDNYYLALVPEPASLALLALGGLALIRRR